MANQSTPQPPTPAEKAKADEKATKGGPAAEKAAKGDVQKKADAEQAQGFIGDKVDPLPDSAHSLESGPDAPPAVPDDRSAVTQAHI